MLPDVDMGIIHAGQPEVGIDIIAHVNVLSAPIGVKRRLNPLQAFLSKAAPVLRVRKGGYDYKHTAAPCKVPALP